MNRTKKLMVNTLILTATSFLMRTIGVSFNVYLTKRIGAAGIGLFQLIITVYSLAVTFGSAGIRLASTRLVVEEHTTGNHSDRPLLRRCLRYGLAAGSIAAAVLYFGAGIAAERWLHDPHAILPLKILAFSLPFVAMSASLGGYFTAIREAPKMAFVQLAEQLIKIGTVALLLLRHPQPDIQTACCVIAMATTVSEVASFSLSYLVYARNVRRLPKEAIPLSGVVARLARIALPDALGAGARSILLTIEHLLIPAGFRKSGSSADSALATYGTIHGMALPLLLYPSAILSSLSSLLVPELAEHHAAKQQARITAISTRVLHLTLLFSVGTAGVFYAFADTLSLAIYHDTSVAEYLRILAPLIPIMYLDMTVDGLLKGLDQQIYSMRYNIIDSAICVALVYVLIPTYAVPGYIAILFISEILNFYLSLNRLITVSQVQLHPISSIVKPLLCILAAFFTANTLLSRVLQGLSATGQLALLITATTVLYFGYLRLVESVTQQDLHWLRRIVHA